MKTIISMIIITLLVGCSRHSHHQAHQQAHQQAVRAGAISKIYYGTISEAWFIKIPVRKKKRGGGSVLAGALLGGIIGGSLTNSSSGALIGSAVGIAAASNSKKYDRATTYSKGVNGQELVITLESGDAIVINQLFSDRGTPFVAGDAVKVIANSQGTAQVVRK